MTKNELRQRPKDFSHVYATDIDLTGVELLLAFHSLKSEVDISPIIEKAKAMGIKTVFPSDDPYFFDNVEVSKINCPALMIVPGLAFTPDGKRLGRGKGFYDRTLSVLPSCVKTLGLCKKSQLLSDLPTEDHDMNVMQVIAL